MPTVLFRREVLSYWQGHGIDFGPAGDWQQWLSAIRSTDAAYLREPTVRFRVHPGQDTQKRGLKDKKLLESHLVIWRYWMVDAVPMYVPSSQSWRYMQTFQASVASRIYGSDVPAVVNELQKMEELRNEQNLKLQKTIGIKTVPLAEAFLFEPDWVGSEWVEVLLSYLEAFLPGDPVALIFPLEKSESINLETAQRLVLELVKKSGRTEFPDVILLDNNEELLEILRSRQHIQWVPKGKGCVEGLYGPFGIKLAESRKLIAQNKL